ncbi:AAA family ATPase [Streptomyces griseus]|uniref:AAA family ATPase n=1 Tax=Streptomyces griseus TaxID=1911 RepID=UPI00362945DD
MPPHVLAESAPPHWQTLDKETRLGVKIRSVQVEGFRGFPNRLTLNFSNSPNIAPVSCLLVGENGTGKSTFVDAIEFCLTGRYPRIASESKQTSLSSLCNFASPDGATWVEVEFTDGSKFKRSIEEEDGGLAIVPKISHPSFKGSGLALHREEIISFLRSTPKARHGIFAEFMRSAAAMTEVPEENYKMVDEAESRRNRYLKERDASARILTKAIRASFGSLRPKLHDVQSFNSWLISRGHSRNADERRYGKLTPKQLEIYERANEVRKAIGLVRRASEDITRAKKAASNAPIFSLLAEVAETLTDSFKRISPAADSV